MNKYSPTLYDDIDEDVYVFKSFGKSMRRLQNFVSSPRFDLILWNKSVNQPEFLRDLHIGNYIDAILHKSIIDIIHDNRNSFLVSVDLP